MSNSYLPGENRGSKSKYLNGGASALLAQAAIEPDDRQNGCWSQQQLEMMNDRFVAQLGAAFASGLESRAAACAEVAGGRKGSAVRARRQASQYAAASPPMMSSMALV